jgi:hypothetical protein
VLQFALQNAITFLTLKLSSWSTSFEREYIRFELGDIKGRVRTLRILLGKGGKAARDRRISLASNPFHAPLPKKTAQTFDTREYQRLSDMYTGENSGPHPNP